MYEIEKQDVIFALDCFDTHYNSTNDQHRFGANRVLTFVKFLPKHFSFYWAIQYDKISKLKLPCLVHSIKSSRQLFHDHRLLVNTAKFTSSTSTKL